MTDDVRIQAGENVADVLHFLEDRLYEHNSEKTDRDDGRLFSRVVRDGEGGIAAGVAGWTWAGVCEITQLWVGATLRGKGIGRTLLQAAEAEAAAQGCRRVLVRTYSFQAPSFYEKCGYRIEQVIEDFPPGHRYFTLMKSL